MKEIAHDLNHDVNHDLNHDLRIHSRHNLLWMPNDKVSVLSTWNKYNFGMSWDLSSLESLSKEKNGQSR